MSDHDSWARRLADTGADSAAAPLRLCRMCVVTLDVTGAGISMVTAPGYRGVVCATDDVSARIEELQITLGEGPCVDAIGSGAPVLVPDLGHPENLTVQRWPLFMEAAARASVRAVFAFPLRIGAINLGALDLYRDRPGELDDSGLAMALMAADAAAIALLRLDPHRDDAFADDRHSRSTYQFRVHQATGMVKVQMDVSIEQAFLILRARAFAEGRSLTGVANDVVEGRLRFSREDR